MDNILKWKSKYLFIAKLVKELMDDAQRDDDKEAL